MALVMLPRTDDLPPVYVNPAHVVGVEPSVTDPGAPVCTVYVLPGNRGHFVALSALEAARRLNGGAA